MQSFPGGAVVKNPPANAGDTGSSPGPGRSHIKKKIKKKMHFTCIKSISLVFYREAELSNPLCYLQIPVAVNDNARDMPG